MYMRFAVWSLFCCLCTKKKRQHQPCGISTVISCSLLNKALTVEAS